MKWSAAQALAWVMRRDPRNLISWTPDMGPEIEGAQKELAAAIGDERVRAWGRQNRHQPKKQIPSSIFRDTGLVVDFAGEVVTSRPHRSYEEPHRWRSMEFDEEECKRLWPIPPPPNAGQWMIEDAKRLQAQGRKGKRADMVKRCMTATGCTKRQAEAAHAGLGPEFKRPRGKPPKTAG